jgi:Transposase and inactivated derivatives, IS30 family
MSSPLSEAPRQYLPKGTDISRRSTPEIQAIADTINNRPHGILGWRTPAEVFGLDTRSNRCIDRLNTASSEAGSSCAP